MSRFFIFSTALTLLATAYSEEQKQQCDHGKQYYRTTLRHIESGGIGYKYGYTTFQAFLATDPSMWPVTPFLDARGHVFNNGKWAANVGIGLRSIWKNFAYGINAYYDYRNVSRFQSNQIGAGLEALGEFFDFRINGYLPISTTISSPYDTVFKNFSGNNVLLSQKFEFAMKGADAELGIHIAKSKNFDFYTAAGPYYFIGEKSDPTWGGKARIGGIYKDILSLEISDSYDKTFHNKFQGQISLNFSFGPRSVVKDKGHSCKTAEALNDRMLQPVGRQEIIVVDKTREKSVAIDPATGAPYFFVFVDNTSNSNGTFESPYHSLAQAEEMSSPNNIIYLYPGDGTTKGMDSGITLQANQKFWGSNLTYQIPTTQGIISLPAQSSNAPTITNTNFDTLGNAITLATNNEIRGLIIDSALNDAIFGVDPQNISISDCTIQNITTFALETTFSEDAVVSLNNNKFLNNTNGISLTLNGTSSISISNNTFLEQTSVSNVPIEIIARNNTSTITINNNDINYHTTGSIRFDITDTNNSNITISNNNMLHNGSGSQSSLGSNIVIIANGINKSGLITLNENTFSENAANALYMHTSGEFTTFEGSILNNTMTNNQGAGLVFGTPATDNLTLTITNNTILNTNDNAIAVISSGTTSVGNITINNNTINDVKNASNGIAVNQDFSKLNLNIKKNQINECEGTGILSYASNGIDDLTVDISNNTITNCQNLSSNAAAGLDLEQFINFNGSVTNNTLSNNVGTDALIGSTLTSPTACLTLTGNTSTSDFNIINFSGTFNLSPCDVDSVNTGTINKFGTIDLVESCSNQTPCP